MKPTATDSELMTTFAHKQDRSAFEELVRRWDQRVLGFLSKSTGDHEAAKDLRQEVFVRVYRYGKSYNPEYAFTTWLFRIVRNVLSTWRTKKTRYLSLVSSATDQAKVLEFRPSPSDTAERREMAQSIRSAINALKPSERELLLLRFELELSYREIAEVQDAPETTVKSRVYKLLAQLRSAHGASLREQHAEG